MLRGRELAKGYLEVVGVVEGIEEIFVEGVNILETGESIQNKLEFFGESLLREFDFSGVEIWDY